MTADDTGSLDHLLLRLRRAEGRRFTKSQLIRSLLRLALADATLLRQVLDDICDPVDQQTHPADRR